jgi:hypothetical protein
MAVTEALGVVAGARGPADSWHLPPSLVPETPQRGISLAVPDAETRLLDTRPWLVNDTDGSLVLPYLFHTPSDVVSGVALVTPGQSCGDGWALSVAVAFLCLVAVVERRRRLTDGQRPATVTPP